MPILLTVAGTVIFSRPDCAKAFSPTVFKTPFVASALITKGNVNAAKLG